MDLFPSLPLSSSVPLFPSLLQYPSLSLSRSSRKVLRAFSYVVVFPRIALARAHRVGRNLLVTSFLRSYPRSSENSAADGLLLAARSARPYFTNNRLLLGRFHADQPTSTPPPPLYIYIYLDYRYHGNRPS